MQRFSFGYQIIPWDLAGEPLGPVLRFLAQTGFQWFEALLGDTLGRDYARRTMSLGPVAQPRIVSDIEIFQRLALFCGASETAGIRPASIFMDGEWLNDKLWPDELARAEVLIRMLESCDAPLLVVGGGPHASSDQPHSPRDYRQFSDRLSQVGQFAANRGIRTVYHPHLDTFIETRDELDRLMAVLDTSSVGLCLDPAHFQIMRCDPVDVLRTYAEAVDYIHLKDCKGDVSPQDGHARYQAFCQLGTGVVDLQGILSMLLSDGYDGIVTIELDYSSAPGDSCLKNVAYIDALGLALTPK
jgi:inosose dehydratase